MKRVVPTILAVTLLFGCSNLRDNKNISMPLTTTANMDSITPIKVTPKVSPKITNTFIPYEDSLKRLLQDDSIFYKTVYNETKYIFNTNTKEEIIDVPTDMLQLRDYHFAVSEDRKKLFYCTAFNGVLGELYEYDIATKKNVNLRNRFAFNSELFFSHISYRKNKILSLIEKVIPGGSTERTNELIEIDLTKGEYRLIKFDNILLDAVFLGNNYLTLNKLKNEKGYMMSITDKNGIKIKDIDMKKLCKNTIYENNNHVNVGNNIVNLIPSPDAKRFLYSFGQTPVELYLFDIEKDQNYKIFEPDYSNSELSGGCCTYAVWSSINPEIFYYFILDWDRDGTKRYYNMFRYNAKENKVEG